MNEEAFDLGSAVTNFSATTTVASALLQTTFTLAASGYGDSYYTPTADVVYTCSDCEHVRELLETANATLSVPQFAALSQAQVSSPMQVYFSLCAQR
jgi:hypothetical protein